MNIPQMNRIESKYKKSNRSPLETPNKVIEFTDCIYDVNTGSTHSLKHKQKNFTTLCVADVAFAELKPPIVSLGLFSEMISYGAGIKDRMGEANQSSSIRWN
jgi:hypothetical protein